MVMCTGVYVNDDSQMVVGVTSTANDGNELESLLQGLKLSWTLCMTKKIQRKEPSNGGSRTLVIKEI